MRESYENGLRKKNEMIADTLINNETVTISGGSTSWAGSTTLRPTITMTREQYLKEVACQEVKDIYAKKLAQEAEAAQTENEIKKRIEDKLGELDKGSIDTTKNKQRKVTILMIWIWITLGNTLMEQGLESFLMVQKLM